MWGIPFIAWIFCWKKKESVRQHIRFMLTLLWNRLIGRANSSIVWTKILLTVFWGRQLESFLMFFPVVAMRALKESLRVPDRMGWNGDPCAPTNWDAWEGITCHPNKDQSALIIYQMWAMILFSCTFARMLKSFLILWCSLGVVCSFIMLKDAHHDLIS